MKHHLACPHCSKTYALASGEVDSWYDNHVLGCGLKRLPIVNTIISSISYLKSAFVVSGRVLLKLMRDGELVDARIGYNVVTTAGKGLIIDRMQAASAAVPDYQAVGTGTTPAAAGDTALETEIGASRTQGTLSQPNATTDRLVTVFAAGTGTGAITETGRLNAAASGTLYARQVFSVVNKGAGDSLTTTHDITVS